MDNVFVERLWRTVKYEDIYLKDYASVAELLVGLTRYWHFYNHERLHQSLGYHPPVSVHFARGAVPLTRRGQPYGLPTRSTALRRLRCTEQAFV